MNIVKLLILSLALLLSLPIKADHEYRLIERDRHKIHVVIINPKEYEVSLAVAHNQVFGRERVGEIAKHENAQIALKLSIKQNKTMQNSHAYIYYIIYIIHKKQR